MFAGGDDLFLIGPWNTIIKLAPVIDESFTSYVCNNPEVHLSAGVSLHKPHTPIDSMAAAAEDAIDKAKAGGRNRLTVYSEVAEWDTVREMAAIREKMESWPTHSVGLHQVTAHADTALPVRGKVQMTIGKKIRINRF